MCLQVGGKVYNVLYKLKGYKFPKNVDNTDNNTGVVFYIFARK